MSALATPVLNFTTAVSGNLVNADQVEHYWAQDLPSSLIGSNVNTTQYFIFFKLASKTIPHAVRFPSAAARNTSLTNTNTALAATVA